MYPSVTRVAIVTGRSDEAERWQAALQGGRSPVSSVIHASGDLLLQSLDQAFDASGSKLPKLIVGDDRLDGLPALELVKRIRSDPRFRHLPFVLLSAMFGADALEAAYRAGANACVIRPADAIDFQRVAQLIAGVFARQNKIPRPLIDPDGASADRAGADPT